jgi:hypothetical protein
MHIFSSGNALKLTTGNLELKIFPASSPDAPSMGRREEKRIKRKEEKGREETGRDGEVASREFDPLGGLGPLNSII